MAAPLELEQPYWATKLSIAPIKSEYVLWDLMQSAKASSTATEGTVLPVPKPIDDDDAAEGRASVSDPNGEPSDLSRSTEEPPRKKQKGQNKGRTFARIQDGGPKLCSFTNRGEECGRQLAGLPCDFNHDINVYLDTQKAEDILRSEDSPWVQSTCPLYETLGICPFGFKCRFSSGHIEKCAEGEGFQGSGLKLKCDTVKLRQVTPANLTSDEERLEWASTTRGEWNVVTPEHISILRKKKVEDLPYTSAYLHSIGEPLDTRPNGGRGNQRSRGGKRGGGKEHDRNGQNAALEDASTKESAVPDTDTGITKSDTILRPVEKKRLNFEGKLYLAPLTTVGNLPFRRLCVKYGADITCGEMGLAQEFLTGNKNEWSLVRRHPSEKCFGVQLCGNRPQTLVAATEHLKAEAPELDFIDINTGCPIDLVVKKGAGSALLDQGSKLGKILRGMSLAAQETPVTIKMRTGIKTGVNTTHKMMPRAVKEWGVGALTIHGRTQQQRYTKIADYGYIKTCVEELRRTSDELDVPSIPIFGNGDAYDHRTYWENVEATGVDGIMIARGALIKPWLFTEIKERRDWDISARERLGLIGELASFGLEHWGSDTMGVNTTRRFLCESMSFTYRYIPVGLLERMPAQLNDRPYPFRGRDDLETLLASDNSEDWVKISSMFLGPPDDSFQFKPKHKSNAYGNEQSNG